MRNITCFSGIYSSVGDIQEVPTLDGLYAYLLANLQPYEGERCFNLQTFHGNHRKSSAYLASSGFVALDLEGLAEPLTEAQLSDTVSAFVTPDNLSHFVLTTRSHGTKGARARLVFEVSPAPSDPREHRALYEQIMSLLPPGTFDPACKDTPRLFRFPPENTKLLSSNLHGQPYFWDPSVAVARAPRDFEIPDLLCIPKENFERVVQILKPLVQSSDADHNRNHLSMVICGALIRTGADHDLVESVHARIFETRDEHLQRFEAVYQNTLAAGSGALVWGSEISPIPELGSRGGIKEIFGSLIYEEIRELLTPHPRTRGEFPEALDVYPSDPDHGPEPAAAYFLSVHFPASSPLVYFQGAWFWYDGFAYQAVHESRFETLITRFLRNVRGVPWEKAKDGTLTRGKPRKLYTGLDFDRVRKAFVAFLADNCHRFHDFDRQAIAFQNGLLDLESYELLPATPERFVVGCRDFELSDLDEDTPELDRFYHSCDFDAPTIQSHLEAMAYACFGSPAQVQKMVVFQGLSRSGKGTSINLIESIIGSSATARVAIDAFESGQDHLRKAVGKQAILIADVHRFRPSLTANILMVSAGEPVPIRVLYKETNEHRLGVIVMGCNETLEFSTGSAIASRMHTIRFRISHAENPDHSLGERLAKERSQIARRLVNVWKTLRESSYRFTETEAAREIKHQTMIAADPVAVWMEERTEFTDRSLHVNRAEVYRDYALWADDFDPRRKLSAVRFYAALDNLHGVQSRMFQGNQHLFGLKLR